MGTKRKKLKMEDLYNSPKDDNLTSKDTKHDDADVEIICNILSGFNGDVGTSLVSILRQTQESYGYIPRIAVNEISKHTGTPTSKIYGMVTFYDEFSTEKRGKYTIKTCCGTACQVKGGKKSMETIKKKLGIGSGETTPDYQFSLETVGCMGACAVSPAILINKQLCGRVTQEKIGPLIDQFAKK